MTSAPWTPESSDPGLGFGVFMVLLTVGLLAYELSSDDLPEGYEESESTLVEASFPGDQRAEAAVVVKAGEDFVRRMQSGYESLLGGLELPGGQVRVAMFSSREEMHKHTSDGRTYDSSLAGFYAGTSREIGLALEDKGTPVPRLMRLLWQGFPPRNVMLIRHELAHYLIGRGGGRMASAMRPWLGEGLARYFEVADLDKPLSAGPVHPSTLVTVLTSKTPSLAAIVDEKSPEYRGDKRGVRYGFGNLLVRFLVNRDARAFWSFARRARAEKLGYGEFRDHFDGQGGLDGEWVAYAQSVREAAPVKRRR